jgi:zinc/manganese transport system substrate-binding protein
MGRDHRDKNVGGPVRHGEPPHRKLMAAGVVAGVLLANVIARPADGALAGSSHPAATHLRIVVAENFWGSIVKQEAGARASVTSLITNPNSDPHAYEPTTNDARAMAQAQYVVFNGAGYDPWVQKLLAANPVKGRRQLNIGDLVGKKEGDNPHVWYSPSYVTHVADQITTDLKHLDPRDASSYAQLNNRFLNTSLKGYFSEIKMIVQKYHGVPVGATESIFVYLASALRLNLITPPGFMKALSEGTEPTAQDRAMFDDQITHKKLKVFVFNIQNSTPDTSALESKAKAQGIPVVAITETLRPAGASFQAWQLGQLKSLAKALAKATGH